jgi:hypothetical protein
MRTCVRARPTATSGMMIVVCYVPVIFDWCEVSFQEMDRERVGHLNDASCK